MEKPTPRAITERLVKIRASAKNAGTSTHFSVSGKPSTGAGTPRKRAGAGSANATKKTTTPKKNGTKASSQAKRKRGGNVSEEYVHILLTSAIANFLLVMNLAAIDSSPKATTPMLLIAMRVHLKRLRQGVKPL